MTSKDLLSFNDNGESLIAETVTCAFLIKVFHLSQKRNEWTNWRGSTGMINRSWNLFSLDLNDATESAEKLRTQGSIFVVDEIPALCFVGKQRALIATELFTDYPLRGCDATKSPASRALAEIDSDLHCGNWYASAVFKGDPNLLIPVKESGQYFSRTSRSMGRNYRLGWSLTVRSMRTQHLHQYAACISDSGQRSQDEGRRNPG